MVDSSMMYKSNSENLTAEELGNNFWDVTISGVETASFDKGDKLVLSFHDTPKKLPLNKTNWKAISSIYGFETDAWINKKIVLFSMPVDFQGKQVLGIRIRAPQAAPVQQSPTQPPQQYDERNPPPINQIPEDPNDSDIPF